MWMFVGGVVALVVSFVVSEIILVRKNTRDLEKRIRHWRGKHGEDK